VRAFALRPGEDLQAPVGLVLAAADPANPYGAALPWPGAAAKSDVLRADDEPAGTVGPVDRHRPARRAGALTVLVDGEAALYAERGGRSLLSFTSDPVLLAAAAEALSERVRSGRIGSLTITKIDGAEALTSAGAVIEALTAAGFSMTPRGLRLRAPAR
jgi:ATP-dependent Lhr-like helicase